MKQELNYNYDPTDKKIITKLNYNNKDFGTDGKHLYVGLFRIYKINDEEVISKCWMRVDSAHVYKIVSKEERDNALKKLGLKKFRKRNENMNYKNKLKEMKIKVSEKKMTEDELKEWREKLFKEFKMQASNVNNISDQSMLLRQIYEVINKLKKYKDEISKKIRENFKEMNDRELDEIAQEKYNRNFDDLDREEQKYVLYIYDERNDDSYYYQHSMSEKLDYQVGDKITIPDYLQDDKNKKQGYTGTVIEITPEEYYKIKFGDGTVALYDSHIWK